MGPPQLVSLLGSLTGDGEVSLERRGVCAHLEDAFDALALGVVALLAVQLPVRVADELQQALGLDVDQHWVLQGTAVL